MSFLELLSGPLQAAKAVLAQAGPFARSLGIPIPEGLLEQKAIEKVQSMQTSIAESGPIPAESAARNALLKIAAVAGVAGVGVVAAGTLLKGRGKEKLKEAGRRAKRKISVTIKGGRRTTKKPVHPKTTKGKKKKQKRIKARARSEGQTIKMTKKGQPYIIDPKTGKARFIKKSSAESSKKRPGGLK